MYQNAYLRFIFTSIIFACLSFIPNTLLQAQCGTNQTEVTVSITTDNYPAETTWELKNWVTGAVYASGGPYSSANTNHTEDVCVPNDATIGFTINDVYGDGICCSFGNGSYSISDGTTTYASGGNFDSEESSLFIIEPYSKDLAIVNLSMSNLLLANTEHNITGRIVNLGSDFVNSFDLNWQADNGMVYTHSYSFPFPSNGEVNFTHSTPWMPTQGEHTLKVWASNINGANDDNPGNDILETLFNVVMEVPIRTVLAEHFTNASCPPCAAQNPAFDALMDVNIAQVAPIKYHTSWPGFDPMYQENSADANARVSLYGVSGVPRAVLDGGQFTGSPNGVNQATINTLASFDTGIILTVDESKAGNIVDIEVTIEALSSISANDLRVHVVAVEKEVNYSSSPGSNGEKDFPYVMRKMLPNFNGTSIADMSANTSTTVNVSYTLPNFVDQNEMRTIVFVQDQTTGFVFQSFLAPKVTGFNFNEQSPTIQAPEPVCALGVDINQENASCGLSNGTINVAAFGGATPFLYQWNNGPEENALSNLAAGTYEVLVTDANDCTTIEIVTIENTEPPALEAMVEESICGEANGSIALSTTNIVHPPLSYQWSAEAVGDTPNAENLLAGTYVVVVTDALGCTTFQSITVEDIGGPEISLTGTEPSCSENGLISANISGGATPYALQWNTGETSENINISEPGNYTLLVTDDNGCTSTQNIDIDSNTDFPSIEVSSQAVCLGESTSATAMITGGASPYQIEWSNGQTGETAEDLTSNVEYSIEVTDANGCKTSDSFSIEAFAPIEEIAFEAIPASCGENNGSITAIAIGGTAPFSYDWNTGETGIQIEGLASATYEVLITDVNGCTAISDFALPGLNAPTLLLSASSPSCNNEGDIAANVSGGTPPYSFNWNTDETTENIQITEGGIYSLEITDASGCVVTENIEVSANIESPSIELSINQPCDGDLGSAMANIEGGTPPYEIEWANGETGNDADGLTTNVFYNVLVTDANGCSASQTFVVESLVGIEAVEATTTAASCEQANGRVSLQITGGTAPYTYDWNTGATSENIEDLDEGIYTVVVTDANGCTFVQEVNIEAIANPIISISTENANCNEANGRAMASVTGGTAPYTFLWDTGETTENIEGLASGTYVLTITDANGCEVIQSIAINDEGAPDASFSVPSEFCIADGELVMTDVQTNGGVFTVNGETIEGNSWTPDMPGEINISYSLTENGCTSISEQMVTVTELFDADWTTMGDVFNICVSDLPLTLLANNSNGEWSSDMGSEVLEGTDNEGNRTITFTAEMDASINSASFSITYQGGTDNCKTSQSNVIRVNKVPQVPEIIGESQFCGTANAPELTLNKFPEFCNCPRTFNVYDEAGNLLQEGETFDNDVFDTAPFIEESGTYTFGMSSVNGPCESNIELFTMEAFEEVTANLSTIPSCDNESGEAVATVMTGVAPYSFEWNNGANTGIISNLSPASYEVVVTDANGCTFEDVISVAELVTPNVDLGEDIVLNEGESVVLDASGLGAVTYLWSTGETGSSIVVTESGIYTLSIFTADGCESMDEIEVSFVTDIPHIEGLTAWNLYPNPAKNQVVLLFDLQENIAPTLEIFDVAGKLQFAQKLQLNAQENSVVVDIEAYPVGVYLVVLKDENGVVMRKLVKE